MGNGGASEGSHNNTANLERNFLKLKELYDTLYKANLNLMKDQKDLEAKYSKLLKAYNKQSQKTAKKAKGSFKMRNFKHSNMNQDIHQNLKRRSVSRKRSLSKGDNSFQGNHNVPYNGLGNSGVSYQKTNVVKTKKKVRKSKRRTDSSAKKSESKPGNSIIGDSLVDGSNASYMSFINDTTMIGGNQSRILSQSGVSEKPEDNLFSNSLIKKSVKMKKKKRRPSNSRKVSIHHFSNKF